MGANFLREWQCKIAVHRHLVLDTAGGICYHNSYMYENYTYYPHARRDKICLVVSIC